MSVVPRKFGVAKFSYIALGQNSNGENGCPNFDLATDQKRLNFNYLLLANMHVCCTEPYTYC